MGLEHSFLIKRRRIQKENERIQRSIPRNPIQIQKEKQQQLVKEDEEGRYGKSWNDDDYESKGSNGGAGLWSDSSGSDKYDDKPTSSGRTGRGSKSNTVKVKIKKIPENKGFDDSDNN